MPRGKIEALSSLRLSVICKHLAHLPCDIWWNCFSQTNLLTSSKWDTSGTAAAVALIAMEPTINFYYVFPFQQNNDMKHNILVSVVLTGVMIPGKTQCGKSGVDVNYSQEGWAAIKVNLRWIFLYIISHYFKSSDGNETFVSDSMKQTVTITCHHHPDPSVHLLYDYIC